MTSRDFCFWLQGYFELVKPTQIGRAGVEAIRNHLNLVFVHEIDPSMPDPTGALQATHDGKPSAPNIPGIRPDQGKPDPTNTILRC